MSAATRRPRRKRKMAKLRYAVFMLLGLAFIVGTAGCSRTTKDITVERHVVGEEFVVE